MPRRYVTLPNVQQSVSRPVVIKVLDQLGDITKASKDSQINFVGALGVMQTHGTDVESSGLDDFGDRTAKLSTERFTFVEVEEFPQKEAMQEVYIWSDENPAMFYDAALGVAIRPVFVTVDVTMNIRYRAPSRSEAERWATQQYLKGAEGRDVNLHHIDYTFEVPEVFMGLLHAIWERREAVEGYGDDFQKYLLTHVSPRSTFLTTQTGKHPLLAVKETQSRIQGLFDFQGLTQEPKRADNSSWEIGYSYRFSYQSPRAVAIEYPMVVHGQLLPAHYLPKVKDIEDPMPREHYYSKSYSAIGHFERGKPQPWERMERPFVRQPWNDDFVIKYPKAGTATWLLAICSLDDTKQDLVSLKELGDYSIDPDVLEFMVGEAPYMTKYLQSLFYITRYKNDQLQPDDSLEVTSDLMVRSKSPLSVRDIHRVRMAAMIDVHTLPWAAIQRLSNYPKAFVKVLAALNELLATNPDFIALRNTKKIEPWELSYAYWVLTGGRMPSHGDYPWTDVINYGGNRSDQEFRFIDSVNPDLVKWYFKNKRLQQLTVQSQFLVAKSINTLAG